MILSVLEHFKIYWSIVMSRTVTIADKFIYYYIVCISIYDE